METVYIKKQPEAYVVLTQLDESYREAASLKGTGVTYNKDNVRYECENEEIAHWWYQQDKIAEINKELRERAKEELSEEDYEQMERMLTEIDTCDLEDAIQQERKIIQLWYPPIF